MTELNRMITKVDYKKYQHGLIPSSIQSIFDEILNSLTLELKEEAISKGFKLIENDRKLDLINLSIVIPDASKELENALSGLSPFIICE